MGLSLGSLVIASLLIQQLALACSPGKAKRR
jgi:hypothetical protein